MGLFEKTFYWMVLASLLLLFQNCGQFSANSGLGFSGLGGSQPYANISAQNPYACRPELLPLENPSKKLLKDEYMLTMNDLFNQQIPSSELSQIAAMIPEDQPSALSNIEPSTEREVEAYFMASQSILDVLLSNGNRRNQSLNFSCQDLNDESCLRDWVANFGLRAYRRPLLENEVSDYLVALQSEADLDEALQIVVMQMLNSPFFLYRFEPQGTSVSSDLLGLTSYEMASRLSYLLTGSMPDEELFTLASSNQLNDPIVLEQQVERLIETERFVAIVQKFMGRWLHYKNRDLSTYSSHILENINMNQGLENAIQDEANDFVAHILNSDGGYEELMLSRHANITDPQLAQIYGVSGVGLTELPADQRRGILSRVAVLADGKDNSSIIHRGADIYSDVLCSPLPDPPPNIPSIDFIDMDQTQRQVVSQGTSGNNCIGCHSLINNMGFPMEQFDSLGRFRVVEKKFDESNNLVAELSIDATSEISINREPASVNGAAELIDRISTDPRGTACFSKQFARYSFGREVNENDECALAPMFDRVVGQGGSVKDMIKALVLSDHFKYRSILTVEGE